MNDHARGISGAGVEAAGHVDAEDRASHSGDHLGVDWSRRPSQACAQKCVDNEVRVIETAQHVRRSLRQTQHNPGAGGRLDLLGKQGIDPFRIGENPRAHLASPCSEVARGHQAVSSVVARPGNNMDACGSASEHPPGTPCHLEAGDLHELDDAHAHVQGGGVEP